MKLRRHPVGALPVIVFVLILVAAIVPASATEHYATETGKACIFCHQERTGGSLSTVGHAYIRNDYRYPIPERILNKAESLQTPLHKTLRLINVIDSLYEDGLLSQDCYFDEDLEWEFYELWHHEGRRARMGAAMMAPDYAWWHGFYELKHRFNKIIKKASALREKVKGHIHTQFPGKHHGQ